MTPSRTRDVLSRTRVRRLGQRKGSSRTAGTRLGHGRRRLGQARRGLGHSAAPRTQRGWIRRARVQPGVVRLVAGIALGERLLLHSSRGAEERRERGNTLVAKSKATAGKSTAAKTVEAAAKDKSAAKAKDTTGGAPRGRSARAPPGPRCTRCARASPPRGFDRSAIQRGRPRRFRPRPTGRSADSGRRRASQFLRAGLRPSGPTVVARTSDRRGARAGGCERATRRGRGRTIGSAW